MNVKKCIAETIPLTKSSIQTTRGKKEMVNLILYKVNLWRLGELGEAVPTFRQILCTPNIFWAIWEVCNCLSMKKNNWKNVCHANDNKQNNSIFKCHWIKCIDNGSFRVFPYFSQFLTIVSTIVKKTFTRNCTQNTTQTEFSSHFRCFLSVCWIAWNKLEMERMVHSARTVSVYHFWPIS